jgi:hypothetical protein|tara:strand:- start:3656 stop:3907 length:252 start_codon:yes stop_codon:yes gene_type:complete
MKLAKGIKRYFLNGYRMAAGVTPKKPMKLGDFVEKVIRIITLGQGKRIAKFVAKLFGYDDCGCDKRQEKLNKYIFTKDGIKKL